MNFKVYNELAWIDLLFADDETYQDEVDFYVNLIKKVVPKKEAKMLHLGCGAGGHDFHFKKYFQVTGVDISKGMLDIAKERNKEITYILGDMKTVQLNETFDIVIIPDSIAYMNTKDTLIEAISNAVKHLKTGGVLFIVAHVKEGFKNNNFVYTAKKEDTQITLFENNHIVSSDTYEATMIYLIRQGKEVSVHHEIHTLGLFNHQTWMDIFHDCHLEIEEMPLNDLYDAYLLDQGTYELSVFVGVKL
jgi:SAM-dependent methyltransferase